MPHPVAGFIILPDDRAGLVLGEIGHIVRNMETEALPGVQNLMHHLEHRQVIKRWFTGWRRKPTEPSPQRITDTRETSQIILPKRPHLTQLHGKALRP
jgi:hypothetical protein